MPSNRCPHFEIFFNEKAFGKNLAPKLHQVSEKALMPPKSLLLSCSQALKDGEIK